MLLMSVFVFSQNSQTQPKPINFENESGVFITIDLMDAISLKLIDRVTILKENESLTQIMDNIKLQNLELNSKFDLSLSQTQNYKELWRKTEKQNKLLLYSYESQKQITKNVKKKHLETEFYISEGVSPSVSLPLLC